MKIQLNSIFSTMAVTGSGIIEIIMGILRMKVLAIFLGPAGVGFYSLLQSVFNFWITVSGLGLRDSGTRQIAHGKANSENSLKIARSTLLILTCIVSALSGVLFFSAAFFETVRLPDPGLSLFETAVFSIGIALSIAAGSQKAVINGFRHSRLYALLITGTATLSFVFGLTAILNLNWNGLVFFVISAPVASFIIGHILVRKIHDMPPLTIAYSEFLPQAKTMLSLGFMVMIATTISTAALLIVRLLLERSIGLSSLGIFAAAVAISDYSASFIRATMVTDFYPKATEYIQKNQPLQTLLRAQNALSVAVAAPVIFVVFAAAELIVQLLFSSAFNEGAIFLRIMLFSSVLRVISYSLEFTLLAHSKSQLLAILSGAKAIIFVFVTYFFVEDFGISSAAYGYAAMHCFYFLSLLTYIYFGLKIFIGWNLCLQIILFSCTLAILFYLDKICGAQSIFIGTLFGALIFFWSTLQLLKLSGSGILNFRALKLFRIKKH